MKIALANSNKELHFAKKTSEVHDIDLVKNFENVGFTRQQAEMQIRTISDIKKGLMTQKDAESLELRIIARMQVLIKNELAAELKNYMTKEDGKRLENRIDKLDIQFEILQQKLDMLPQRITYHFFKTMGMLLGVYPLWLILKKTFMWFKGL